MQGEHEVGETGEHASPDELWPGMSAEASHAAESAEAGQGIADDSATWRADQATLQRALDQAMAQPIDPSRRPMWTDTSGEEVRTFCFAWPGAHKVPRELCL